MWFPGNALACERLGDGGGWCEQQWIRFVCAVYCTCILYYVVSLVLFVSLCAHSIVFVYVIATSIAIIMQHCPSVALPEATIVTEQRLKQHNTMWKDKTRSVSELAIIFDFLTALGLLVIFTTVTNRTENFQFSSLLWTTHTCIQCRCPGIYSS